MADQITSFIERLRNMPKYDRSTRPLPHATTRSIAGAPADQTQSRKSLRVLAVLSQRPGQTGSGVYLRELVGQLQELGHEVHLLAADYRILTRSDFPQLPNERIHTVVFDSTGNQATADLSFPISGMSLDMPYPNVPFRELSDRMLEKYVSVWTRRIQYLVGKIQPDIVHVNHLWLLPGIARLAGPHLPIVSTAHGSSFLLLQDQPAFGSLIVPGIRALDAIISVSQTLASDIANIHRIPSNKICVIENGYNPHLFRVLSRDRVLPMVQDIIPLYDPDRHRKVVLYVGKFAAYKGLSYLLRAAKMYDELMEGILTVIIGDGSRDIRGSLEDLVRQLQLEDKVLLPGKLPYSKVGLVMNLADVFVLPSTYEGFGLVLLESLACGIRSVASNQHGPSSFVPKALQEKGLVILVNPLRMTDGHPTDATAEQEYTRDLAEAIMKQLNAPTAKAERDLIANSVKGRDWASQIKKTEQVYFDVIDQRREVESYHTWL